MRKFKLPADLKEDAIKNLDPNQTTNRRSCGPLLRYDFNDSGNASKFLECYKDDVLYDPYSKHSLLLLLLIIKSSDKIKRNKIILL